VDPGPTPELHVLASARTVPGTVRVLIAGERGALEVRPASLLEANRRFVVVDGRRTAVAVFETGEDVLDTSQRAESVAIRRITPVDPARDELSCSSGPAVDARLSPAKPRSRLFGVWRADQPASEPPMALMWGHGDFLVVGAQGCANDWEGLSLGRPGPVAVVLREWTLSGSFGRWLPLGFSVPPPLGRGWP
jgi:hypothetical protein